jgi:hypothetical protein
MILQIVGDQCVDPAILAGEGAHRPVGSGHETRRAKCIEHDVEVRADFCKCPATPVRFRHQSRELAPHVRMRRQRTEIALPFEDPSGANLWLGKVIEDEGLTLAPRDEFRGDRQVTRINQDVVGQTEFFELRDPTAEVIAQEKSIVRLSLHDVPDTYKFRVRRKALQLGPDVVRLQINPADHAGDARVLVRELQQPACFFQRLSRLNRDAGVHSSALHLPLELPREKVPSENRHGSIDPVVLRRLVAPEVLMSVDAHPADVGLPSALRLGPLPGPLRPNRLPRGRAVRAAVMRNREQNARQGPHNGLDLGNWRAAGRTRAIARFDQRHRSNRVGDR